MVGVGGSLECAKCRNTVRVLGVFGVGFLWGV